MKQWIEIDTKGMESKLYENSAGKRLQTKVMNIFLSVNNL